MIDYDENQRQADELRADLAERQRRRLAGELPPTWELPPREPEREPVKAMPAPNLLRLVEEVNAHTERRLLETVEMLGAETGKNDSVTRKSIEASATRVEDLLRAEMRQGFARNATELMRLRELREANQADLKLQIVSIREEMLALREQLAELRGVTRPKKANGVDRDASLS